MFAIVSASVNPFLVKVHAKVGMSVDLIEH